MMASSPSPGAGPQAEELRLAMPALPPKGPGLAAVLDRAAVVDRALEACMRADATLTRTVRVRDEARALRAAAAAHGWPRVFLVNGVVEGTAVRALWWRRQLVATAALLRRAQVLVAMGERFDLDEQARAAIPAGLHDPIPALLTLMRACDHVSAVQLGPLKLRVTDPPSVASGGNGIGW